MMNRKTNPHIETTSKNQCVLLAIFGGNPDFFTNGLMVTLKSLERTNPDIPVVIFYDQLTGPQKKSLLNYTLIKIDSQDFNFHNRKDLTPATCYKFHLERLREYDRVLYLDCDLVVLDDLCAMFETPGVLVGVGRPLGSRHDFLNYKTIERSENIPKNYLTLNGGVVCFDRSYWQEHKLYESIIDITKTYGWKNFINADQGILNLLACRHGGFTCLSTHYNYCTYPEMEYTGPFPVSKNKLGVLAPVINGKSVCILHWNGPVKPWQLPEKNCQTDFDRKYYYDCYAQFTQSTSPNILGRQKPLPLDHFCAQAH